MRYRFHNQLYLAAFLSGFIVVFFLSSRFVFAYTPKAGSPLANRSHPRLLITQASIPGLRDAIATHYLSKYQEYVDWAVSGDGKDTYNVLDGAGHDILRANMVHQAFVYAIGKVPGIIYPISIENYGQLAISRLKNRLTAGDELAYAAALTYDWTYNLMTSSERLETGNALKSRTIKHKVFVHSVGSPSIVPQQMFSSKYYENFYAWYMALALWGDGVADVEADKAVDTFFDVMLNYGYLDGQNFISGHDGGWPEWIGYSHWHPRSHIILVTGWNTATDDNYISKNGIVNGNAIKAYPEFMYYALDPHKYTTGRSAFVRMGGAETVDPFITGSRSVQSQLHILPRFLAEAGLINRAGLVRNFLDSHDTWFGRLHHYIWGFLGVPKNFPALKPGMLGLEKSRWMKNMGAFIARTGFENPADSVFYVSDGHYHVAGDRGVQTRPGFGINKFGPLINTRNVAHRSFGNLEDYTDAHRDNIVYFEGGHGDSHGAVGTPTDLKQAINGEGDFDWGGIEQVTVRDGEFYHLRSDRSRHFQSGVQHSREYIWIPGKDPVKDTDFLVVYDRTLASSKPHWVFHVPWKPEVANHASTTDLTAGTRIGTGYTGKNIIVKELNSLGGEKDNDGGTADFTGGGGNGAHGVAFSKTILPLDARVEVSRVSSFDADVFKRQHEMAINTHRWQVDVIPTLTSTEHRFLHVIETGDEKLKTAMTSTSLLEVGSQMQGVWIERPAADRPNHVVLFNKEEGVRTETISYTVSGSGQVRHIVTGLKPATSYQIKDITNGNTQDKPTEIDTRLWDYKGVDTNSVTGTIFFESTISGTHTFTLIPKGTVMDIIPPAPPANLIISQIIR